MPETHEDTRQRFSIARLLVFTALIALFLGVWRFNYEMQWISPPVGPVTDFERSVLAVVATLLEGLAAFVAFLFASFLWFLSGRIEKAIKD